MTEQRKAEQVKTERIKTDRIKLTLSIEVKSTTSELNNKTACQCCPNDKR